MSYNLGGRTTNIAKNPKGKFTAKATSQVLVTENGSRAALYICNPSDKEVWIALGETAAKEEGIWLKKETTTPIAIVGYTGPVSVITTSEEGSITYAEA